MSFAVPADAYDRFMGRYSVQLSSQLADLAGVRTGQRVVDVGCGPGALTGELLARRAQVSAVDPSAPFVEAVRERYPDVDAQIAPAEDLPFEDGTFDAALAQLVVHFMADPVAGLREMGRVTHSDGVVAACVWDHEGGQTPLAPFWQVVRELDPTEEGEGTLAGGREGHLSELFAEAGLADVEETALPVRVEHATFDDWWEPFTLGVGPAGGYLQAHPEKQEEIRERCRLKLGEPVVLETRAWAARGVARRPAQ